MGDVTGNGWPFDPAVMEARRNVLDGKGLLTHVHFDEASHHLHIDPSTREAVAERIVQFFLQES